MTRAALITRPQRPSRGALLLEMLFAVAIFGVCMLVVSGALTNADASLSRAEDRQRTFGMARSVMSLLESGVRTPQNMTGYFRSSEILSPSIDDDDNEDPSQPEWFVEVETESTPFEGLTNVMVRVSHSLGGEDMPASSVAVLHQLVRLGELVDDSAGDADATLRRILDAEAEGGR